MDKALVHLNSTHPELENVSLYRGTCTQIGLSALFTLENISVLKLERFDISGDLSSDLEYTQSLEKLILTECFIASRSLTPMLRNISANLKHLELFLTSASLHGVGVDGGIVFPNLTFLMLTCEDIRDIDQHSFLSGIGKGLKVLKLRGESYFSTFEFCFPELEILSLRSACPGCPLKRFSSSDFSNLKVLDLSGSKHIDETVLCGILTKAKTSLTSLIMTGTNVTLNTADSIYGSFSSLEELNLSCQNLSDTGLLKFLNKTGETLSRLNISGSTVSLSQMQYLNSSFPKLDDIDLRFCDNIEILGLLSLLSRVSPIARLKTLDTNAYYGLSTNVIRDSFPTITIDEFYDGE